MQEHFNYVKTTKVWDYRVVDNFWIGGRYPAPNLSNGYHAILKQWWECYKPEEDLSVLLVSESNQVKEFFNQTYPRWLIKTIDLFPEIANDKNNVDIVADICAPSATEMISERFDLIINQATLEHVYDPFGAMRNLCSLLASSGVIVNHTHPPGFPYHAYPHDYFRFMIDWWPLLENKISYIKLKELVMVNNRQVFSCYQRV